MIPVETVMINLRKFDRVVESFEKLLNFVHIRVKWHDSHISICGFERLDILILFSETNVFVYLV